MTMDGVLVIDKPGGPTSHDVVARVRRVLGVRRLGHTGTLDPLATGVLPLVIGRATRLASLLTSSQKTYEAGVRLGAATDSYDAAERIAAGIPPPPAPAVSRDEVERALDGFRGDYMQPPPPYSAKKIGGVAAHRLARRNTPVQPKAVPVQVSELALLDLAGGLVTLRVTASAGFYVRSLAHTLGQTLGCGAHLESLRRTAAGVFTLEHAVTPEVLESDPAAAARWLIPMEALLLEMPAVVVNAEGVRRTSHGNDIRPADVSGPWAALGAAHGELAVRLTDENGRLLAIAREGLDGALRPSIVLV